MNLKKILPFVAVLLTSPSIVIAATNTVYLQHVDSGLYYAANESGQLVLNANTVSVAQGFQKVAKGKGYSWKAVGGSYNGLYSHEPKGENRQILNAKSSDSEVFIEHNCGKGDVYFTSDLSGKSVKNEPNNNMLGNGSSGDCESKANRFSWVSGTSIVETKASTTNNSAVKNAVINNANKIPEAITNKGLWDLEGDTPNPLVNPHTLVFLPLEAKVTTPNGNGWRHEYKIAKNRRIAMTDTYEKFKATIKVDLSTGGKTIVAQHHAGDTGTIMKLYIADSSESGFNDSEPANGIFDVYVRIRNTSGVEEKKPLGTIRSGDEFSFEVINNYGLVKVSAFGKNLETKVEDDSRSYLKFGNYLQSQTANGNNKCGKKGNSDSFAQCYKKLGITESKITMTNVSYERIER